MLARLDAILRHPRLILDIDGWRSGSTQVLQQRYPQAVVWQSTPDEPAAQRQRQLLRPAWWWPSRRARSVASHVVSEPELDLGHAAVPAQLLWANMALHARLDLAGTLQRWQSWLGAEGFLMMSTLGPDTLRELARLPPPFAPRAAMQPWVDMHDLGDELVRAGFADPVMDVERITLTYEDPRRLVADLHALGAARLQAGHVGLRTPGWRSRWWHALQEASGASRVPMTFEIVHGHAFKALPRARLQGETSVALDDMRRMLRHGREGSRAGPAAD